MNIKISCGFLSLLTLLLIALKLTHYIDWPWGWVLSPLWLPMAITIAGIIFLLSFALVIMFFLKFLFKDIKREFMKAVASEKK